MGVDPGLRVTGYGVVDLRVGQLEPRLVEGGTVQMKPRRSLEKRLATLHTDLAALIAELKPDRVVVEQLFSHYAHPRTAILMGHARGVILLAAAQAGLEVTALRPTEVKKSLTGNGHATKEQMQQVVASQLGLAAPPRPADVADAIAITLCAGRRLSLAAM